MITYRIKITSGMNANSWAILPNRNDPASPGFNYTTSLAQATVFETAAQAYAAGNARNVKYPKQHQDFTVVPDFGTYEWPKIESTYGTPLKSVYETYYGKNEPTSYLFVGGPANGKQIAILDGGTSYAFSVLSPISWTVRPMHEASAISMPSIGEAVYVRMTLAAPNSMERQVVYVFSGVRGLQPEYGAKVLFEGLTWIIDDVKSDAVFGTGITQWFQARRSNSYPMNRSMLTGKLSDLAYQWATETWTFKKGAVVQIDETRTVTV